MTPKIPAVERFEKFVDRTGPISLVRGVVGSCWIWTGALFSAGYGAFHATERVVRAHRFAYEQACGAIPDGLVLDHRCRQRNCVRPSHLEAVTTRTNTLRGMSPGAIARRTNRCRRGHELTPESTITRRNGTRICRVCDAARSRLYRARRRAAQTPERTAA